jgi:N-acetylglucosamine-6-sulfatase
MTKVAWSVAVAAIVAGVIVVVLPGAGGAQAPQRPNVVVVMTDDQTLRDMSVMPRTRALIGDPGVTFTQNFASYALCCPSRATFLTGQYSHNNGVLGNRPPRGGFGKLDGASTLPVALQRQGYETVHIGKYLNGYGRDAGVPPGWTDWHGAVDPSTYLMYGYTLNENGTLNTYGSPTVEDPALYQTDVYRQKAIDVIRRPRDPSHPLFLSVAFLAPHSEAGRATAGQASIRPAPRHKRAFANMPLPRPPSFNERNVRDKPAHVRNAPRLRPQRIDRITANFRARREALLSVDEAVEGIVGALAETGQLDNTYILFTADNGFFHGEHRVPNGKYLPYDVSTHLPLLVRGPGIQAGGRSAELVSNVDLAATIADVAGVTPIKPVDGRSLIPYAKDPAERSRRPILHEGLAAAEDGDVDQDGPAAGRRGRLPVANFTGIRTPRWLYVEYDGGERELYDLRRDPHELRSLHRNPRYTATRRSLARQLAELRRCAGAACVSDRPPPPAG